MVTLKVSLVWFSFFCFFVVFFPHVSAFWTIILMTFNSWVQTLKMLSPMGKNLDWLRRLRWGFCMRENNTFPPPSSSSSASATWMRYWGFWSNVSTSNEKHQLSCSDELKSCGVMMELTVAQVASRGLPSHPAAFVSLVLPATVGVPVDKTGILTADEQHLKIVAEVFQLHPDVQKQKKTKTKNKEQNITSSFKNIL